MTMTKQPVNELKVQCETFQTYGGGHKGGSCGVAVAVVVVVVVVVKLAVAEAVVVESIKLVFFIFSENILHVLCSPCQPLFLSGI